MHRKLLYCQQKVTFILNTLLQHKVLLILLTVNP